MRLSLRTSPITTYDIKCLAAFLMVVDHLGVVFDIPLLRWLGRFSLPLFGFVLVIGINYTSNYLGYYLRLLTFALISQFPYVIFLQVNGRANDLNILFLFVCAYPVIYYLKRRAWLEVVVCSILALVFVRYCNYGYYGLGLLISLYLFFEIDYLLAFTFWSLVTVHGYLFQISYQAVVIFMPLIPIFISDLRTLKPGRKARWFYWFYPLHFIPLICLKYVASL